MLSRSKHGIFKPHMLLAYYFTPDGRNAMNRELWGFNAKWYVGIGATYPWYECYEYQMGVSSHILQWWVAGQAQGTVAGAWLSGNYWIDFLDTFSPVAKHLTIRMFFTLATQRGWPIHQVNNTFLNGTLDETMFMSKPHGFVDVRFPNHVCELRKPSMA